uniref:CCHC-type domain-containing protein n=1 Tax=Biomphalaria glabrata TaxID=6526 RepID=A0A2C9L038_BIOGL
MDRIFRPEKFDIEHTAPQAAEHWQHWYETLKNFISVDKLDIKKLINYISPAVYQMILDKETFDEAIQTLNGDYIQPKNEVFARHRLATCKQEQGQTIDAYMQKLRILSKDCNFKAVTAAQHREEAIRDLFINRLVSKSIQKRLLEKTVLSLKDAFEEARLLEHAYQHSLQYESSQPETNCAATTLTNSSASPLPNVTIPLNALASKCYFCGSVKHPRSQCPAREATCNKCFKKGHFQRVCKSRSSTVSAIATVQSLNLNKSTIPICINNVQSKALVDTGSCESYISTHIAKKHK